MVNAEISEYLGLCRVIQFVFLLSPDLNPAQLPVICLQIWS